MLGCTSSPCPTEYHRVFSAQDFVFTGSKRARIGSFTHYKEQIALDHEAGTAGGSFMTCVAPARPA